MVATQMVAGGLDDIQISPDAHIVQLYTKSKAGCKLNLQVVSMYNSQWLG